MKNYIGFIFAFLPCILLPIASLSHSYQDALLLQKQADEIQQQAQTHEDLCNAEQKYLQAIETYDKMGERKHLPIAYKDLAKVYIAQGNYEKAENVCLTAIQISRELKDQQGEGYAVNILGMVYKYKNLNDKASDYFEKSLTLARMIQDPKLEGYALHNLGMVYHNWGQRDKALDHYTNALHLMKKVEDHHCEANILNNIGRLYLANGQYDKAKEIFSDALCEWTNLKSREGEASTLNNLGLVHFKWGKYDEAADYFQQSFTLAKELRNPRLGSSILLNLGLLYRSRGHFSRAADFYQLALQLETELGNRLGQGMALNNLGTVYLNWGYYDKAREYYQQSLELSRELKNPDLEETSLANLGLVNSYLGQYITAVEFYKQSLVVQKELKNPTGEALTLSNIGTILQYRGDHDKALEFYKKSLDILNQLKVPNQRPLALIADTYLDMGDFEKAEPFLYKANYYALWGRYYLLKSEFAAAKEYYSKLAGSAEDNRAANDLFTAYTGIAACLEGLNENEAALENYQKAVKLTEELRSSLLPNERERFFDVRINGFLRTAPYEGMARVLFRLNKPQEAFQASEYTKSRLFAEAMTRMTHNTTSSLAPEIKFQDDAVNNELALLKKNLKNAVEANDKLLIRSLESQVGGLESMFADHIKMLRADYPLFAATKYPQPVDISNTALRDNEWLLSYDVTETGVLVYLIQGKRIVHALFNPISRRELEELVRKFRDPLEAKTGFPILEQIKYFDFDSGNQLFTLLLKDILPLLPEGEPLIIIPSGALGIIPFEMLAINTDNKVTIDKPIPCIIGTDFFGDRNPISYYQSVTALTLMRTLGQHRISGNKQLLMVDPVFDREDFRCKQVTQKTGATSVVIPQDLLLGTIEKESKGQVTFPRLELTRALGDSLRKLQPDKTDEFRDLNARKQILFERTMDEYKFMTFATHGYFGKDLPGIMEPVLVFTLVNQPAGTDGYLRLSEVMGLSLNAEIVALTACQTGIGQHISGEGTMGMGRAFQHAGAKSVLASLWSVSEMTSVNLVKIFFEEIKAGKNRLQALKSARDTIRKAGYDHPFFWAPFVLVGEINERVLH